MSSTTKLQQTLKALVTANHILHFHEAVDGFGHVSVRHPEKPDVYIMSGYIPPAPVEREEDLIHYYVDGSAPVDPHAKKGYSERFIHGEMFKRYPNVQCVVHSHAESVIPFTANTVAMLPMYHMAGFLGERVPVWDITPLYDENYQSDMLVNNEKLGASLANAFSSSEVSTEPERNVVLMRRHGCTTWGKDIATAVYRAVYTSINASVQTFSMLTQTAARDGGLVDTARVDGLTGRHAEDCQKMTEATQDKAWRLWEREVEASPRYRNAM